VGALLTAPAVAGVPALDGYRLLIWAYAAAGVALAVLFARLSPTVEADSAPSASPGRGFGLQRSRATVAKLAGLFALDAFAGGFIIQSLLALWFHLRFGADPATLGGIFFGMNLMAAISFLGAAPLARRFGLLNTMVFSHLPSNVILMLVPLMPTLESAVVILLVRYLLSQLDVPTRQSYTMAIVDPAERAAAGGLLHVSRSAAASIAPAFAGATLTNPVLGLPFLLAGGLKIIYDLAIWSVFRRVHPPEEVARHQARAAARASRSAVP
jgi:hypothetical protein